MANFAASFKQTSGIEKGYTVDNGGPTYMGVSQKGWGTDPLVQRIFKIVFAAKPKRGQIINNKDLDILILAFYKKNYWDRVHGDAIENQQLANFIYDFSVNSYSAPIIINKAIGSGSSMRITSDTLNILNSAPSDSYNAIKISRRKLYDSLAAKHPAFKKNGTYKGWLSRLSQFPRSIAGIAAIGKIQSIHKVIPQLKVKIVRGKGISQSPITSSYQSAEVFKKYIGDDKIQTQEFFALIYMNQANLPLGVYMHSQGGMTATIADIRLILGAALQIGATSMIICHNHPSGALRASQADLELTEKLKIAAKQMDIKLLDHVIITKESYYSFADEGRL